METSRPARAPLGDRVAVERFMGVARIVGGGLAYSQFVPFTHFPPGVKPIGLALATAFVVHGAVTLRRVPRGASDLPWLERWMLVSFGIDLALLTTLNLVLAYEEGSTTRGLLLLMILEGAMKYQRRGALTVLALIVAEETARFGVRTIVYERNSDIAEGTFFMGLALLVALFAGWMAHLAHTSLREATDARDDAERAREELEVLNHALVVGVDGIADESLEELLGVVAGAIGARRAQVVLVDRDGGTYAAASHGHDDRLLEEIDVAPDSPLDDVLTGRTSEPFTHGDAGRDTTYAPIRVHGDLLGALVLESGADGATLPAAALGRLATQVGLVVRAVQAYAQQAALAERMVQLDRLRNDFITVASHELRTPVTAILGFAETLDRGGDHGIDASVLHASILRQSKRLAALVDDLNTVLALDSGRVRLDIAPTPVREPLERAADRADAPVVVGGDLELVVEADANRLEQVVLQLLANAVEHGGGIGLRIEVEQAPDGVEIAVVDDGPGVPEAIRHEVFDRYVQGHAALQHQRGSGLGLSIARQITHAMGGHVRLDPSERGARFVISLPAAGKSRPAHRVVAVDARTPPR